MTVPTFPFVFNGGQMTDLPPLTLLAFDGTELFEIVAPGNASEGLNYRITSAQLSSLLQGLQSLSVIISQGENISALDPFIVPTSVTRVYVNKPIAEPTFIQFGNVSTYLNDVIIGDVAGTAAVGNGITTTFTGGQTASGNATVPIENAYGGWSFRPVNEALSGLATWFLGSA
jgi:hypothetical protein